MKFQTSDTLNYPLDDVYSAFRDKMVELPKFLTNLEKITMISRDEKKDGDVYQESIWEAKVKLPGPMEKLVPTSGRTWRDIATWRVKTHTVEWRTITPMFTEAIDIHGVNSFAAEGAGATKITLSGDIIIDPKKLTGVPTFIAKGLVPTIEKFIVSTVQKNFVEGNRAWERYFAAQEPKAPAGKKKK